MMRRFAVQIYLNPKGDWHFNALLTVSDDGEAQFENYLESLLTESAQTQYLDGVVSTFPFSLRESLAENEIRQISEEYNYLFLGDDSDLLILQDSNKPLMIDFGSIEPEIVQKRFVKHVDKLLHLNMREFIYAACIRPAIYFYRYSPLTPLAKSYVHWEDLDVMNNRFTADTRIRSLDNY